MMFIKIKNNRKGSRRGSVMIQPLLEKLQKRLPFLAPRGPYLSTNFEFDNELEVTKVVPDDVKEGHFVVFAVKGEETRRFIVELGYPTNPTFLRLLDLAEEKYGFKQRGALTIPCLPQELQEILEDDARLVLVLEPGLRAIQVPSRVTS